MLASAVVRASYPGRARAFLAEYLHFPPVEVPGWNLPTPAAPEVEASGLWTADCRVRFAAIIGLPVALIRAIRARTCERS
jgi:hypothetical protein